MKLLYTTFTTLPSGKYAATFQKQVGFKWEMWKVKNEKITSIVCGQT